MRIPKAEPASQQSPSSSGEVRQPQSESREAADVPRPTPLTAANYLLHMQRTFGNRYVQRMISSTKEARDPEEPTRRVDLADVVRPPARTAGANAEPERHARLDAGQARFFGEQLGADFSGVSIHSGDSVAREHGAAAITFGSDIHFADRNKAAGTLLGHELVHTVQQGAVPVEGGATAVPGSRQSTEQEANRLGEAAAQGRAGEVQRRAQPNSGQAAAPERGGVVQNAAKRAARPVAVRSSAPAAANDPLARVEALQKQAARTRRPRAGGRSRTPRIGRPVTARPSGKRAGSRERAVRPRGGAPGPRLAGKRARGAKPVVRSTPAPPPVGRPTPLPAAPALTPDIPAAAPSADAGRAVIGEGTQVAGRVRQAATAAAASIRTTAEGEMRRLQSEQTTRSEALRDQAATGYQTLADRERAAATGVASESETAQAAVGRAGDEATALVEQTGAEQRRRASESGDQAGSDFATAAAGEGSRFEQLSTARTSQAQESPGGDGESAAAQAEASGKIGDQASQNFEKDTAGVREETQQAATDFRSHVGEGVSSFTGAIDEAVPQTTSGISGLASAAQTGFAETAARASGSLSSFASEATGQLAEGASAAQNLLAGGVQATASSIQSTAEKYAAEVEQHGEEAAQAIIERAYAAGNSVAQSRTRRAPERASEARAGFEDAAAKSTSALERLGAQVAGGLGKHGGAASAELAKAASDAGSQMQAMSSDASKRLDEAQGQFTRHLAAGATTVSEQARQTAADAAAELDKQGSDFGSKVAQGAGDARQQLATRVDAASSEQQTNLDSIEGRKSSAVSEISSEYSTLQSEGDSRSQQQQTEGQPFLDWILPASWTKAIKDWFANTFGNWLGGFLYGIISALIGLVIIIGILAAIAFFFTPFAALLVGIGILVVAAIVGIYSRFKMFAAYNGRGPGFWEGTALVVLGILDVSGVPQIIEGLIGARAFSNGHKMDDFEAGENVGSGIVQLIAIIFAIRGAKGAVKPGEVKPPEVKPPEVKPGEPVPPETKPPENKPPETKPGEPKPDEGGPCFVAGTLVWTPDGRHPIELLSVGDKVLACDPATGEQSANRVLAVSSHSVGSVLDIRVAATTITCTPGHPFWCPGTGWVEAGQLRSSMPVLLRTGDTAPVEAIEAREGTYAVFNLTVDALQTYFVSSAGVLVHNKPARNLLTDRAIRLEESSREVLADAEALPAAEACRAGLVEQARALQTEAADLAAKGRAAANEAALEPHRSAIERTEKRIVELDDMFHTVRDAPNLQANADALLARAETSIPDTSPMKWDIIGRIKNLRSEIAEMRKLIDNGLIDKTVSDDYFRLQRSLSELEAEVAKETPGPPPGPDIWQQRLDRAKWSDHGNKHKRARSAEEAKEMTTSPDAASQYLPEVNNQALELEALQRGTVIKGDPDTPGSTVHVKYDAGRVIGYDGGEAVTTMRAEISGGDVYHGHPRNF